MYLFVSLSMNRLVKSFTWATRSPKGFTLRATLSEVSRTKNRSTGQSGKKQRGRSWWAALLHRLPSPASRTAGTHSCSPARFLAGSQGLCSGDRFHILTPCETCKHTGTGEVAHFCFGTKGKLYRAHIQKPSVSGI